jgi:hypothetical protein
MSLRERWLLGSQPQDTREALIEVAVHFLLPSGFRQLPTEEEAAQRHGEFSQYAAILTKEWCLAKAQRAAVRQVDVYLARKPLVWRPGMWKQRLPNFVEYPIYWRSAGKCEACHRSQSDYAGTRVLHHLHYRSVGREVPEDLLLICSACHELRHRYGGQFYADPETHPVFGSS